MSTSEEVRRVSVVVPTYQGEEWVGECLVSLAEQTLPTHAYEIVLVSNGPRTRSPQIAAEIAARYPGLRITVVETDVANLSNARNLGLDAATAPYVTFVDDDDRVGPRFLEVLLAAAEPDVIAVAAIGFVDDDDFATPSFDNNYARTLQPRAGLTNGNRDLQVALHCPWAKIVRTELARAVRFDPAMRAEEDLVFWLSVVTAEPIRLVLAEQAPDAAYLYRIRAGSLMQVGGQPTWDFNVARRLSPLAVRDRLDIVDPETNAIRSGMQDASAAHIRRYLAAFPAEWPVVEAVLTRLGLRHDSWRELLGVIQQSEFALSDPSEAARVRIAERGHAAARFECELGEVRAWRDIAAGVSTLIAEMSARVAEPRLVSVSARPEPHLACALVKALNPDVEWHAEILDGAHVGVQVEMDEVVETLATALVRAGYAHDTVPDDAVAFTRLVVETLADWSSTPATTADVGLEVSVVVPTYAGDDWLDRCLRALGHQRIAGGRFEVIVVHNGPSNRAEQIVEAIGEAFPDHTFRFVHSDRQGASAARNLGLDLAAAPYVTFVDDDDWVGAGYLEGLLANCGPARLAVALMAVSSGRGRAADPNTWLGRAVMSGTRHRSDFDGILQSACCKAVPTDLARSIRFDESMHFAEDTLFWFRLVARYGLEMAPGPATPDASYFYCQRSGSATSSGGYDLNIGAYLRAIRALREVPTNDPDMVVIRERICGRFVATMGQWIAAHPGDRRRMVADVVEQGLSDLPWAPAGEVVARDIARTARNRPRQLA